MEASSVFEGEPLRRGVQGKVGRVDSNPDKIRAWVEAQNAGELAQVRGLTKAISPDEARRSGQEKNTGLSKEHSRKTERGVRPVPGKVLQELMGAVPAPKKEREVHDADASPVSSMFTLSGDLDHSISFGDVRNYLGPEGSKCTIRRQKQEFFLEFESPESARSCFAGVALYTATHPFASGSHPCKPLVKGGKQRSVYTSFMLPEESPSAPLLSNTKTGSHQEPKTSTHAPSKKASQATSNSENSSIESRKDTAVRGEQLNAPLAPSEAEPSTSICDLQQKEDTLVSDSSSSVLQPLNLKPQSHSSDFPSQEHQSISLASNSRFNTGLHKQELKTTRSSDFHSREHHLESNSKANTDLQKQTDDILHELLAQETLRLLTEKARFQKEAQEKGRQVDRLQRQVDLLLEELDTVHSRLSASESLTSENLRAPSVPSLEPQASEDGRKKRKKSGVASLPSKTEGSPQIEKVQSEKHDDVAEATGWVVESQTKAAAMDASPTGWGGPSGTGNDPPKISSDSAKDSGLSPGNRHKRGAKSKGGRKMEAFLDEEASVSSEAVGRRSRQSSSDVSGVWEAPDPNSKEQRDTSSRQAAPHWDAQSTASSLGDGGTRTPSLQEGEWEWPASPGVQIPTGGGSPGANQHGKCARLEKGLLPVPGAEKKSHGVKRFEAGSPQSGREKDNRARKSRKEGDYAGAPRQRVAPEGKWPRGLVT